MSRVLTFFSALVVLLAVAVCVFGQTPAPAADVDCKRGCEPWLPLSACKAGADMKLRLVVDASVENSQNVLHNNYKQIGFGFCPVVDQLQAFSLPQAAGWAAGDFKNGNFTNDDIYSTHPAYLRIYGAVGSKDTSFIPKDSYSASALLFDQSFDCVTDNNEPGYLVANFLVINFTMTNGVYRLIDSFDQSVQVGFQPTCDGDDICQISPSQPCLGNTTGYKNCAVCVAKTGGVPALNSTDIQVFASYYGTDSTGRKMQSGSSNPLNFLALSSTGVFNKLKNDINGAVNTVKKQIPGEN